MTEIVSEEFIFSYCVPKYFTISKHLLWFFTVEFSSEEISWLQLVLRLNTRAANFFLFALETDVFIYI